METFHVTVLYKILNYQSDNSDLMTQNFVVEALDEQDAQKKIYEYYNNRSVSYSHTYDVLEFDFWTKLA